MSSTLRTILMNRDKPGMVRFLEANPENFEQAMLIALSLEQPVSWRATWMIGGSVKRFSTQIQPYIPRILDLLSDLEDGHQREFLKILIQLDLDEEFEGRLLDLSIEIWEHVRKKPSVRHFAFRIMYEAVQKYPELTNEILVLTQSQYVNSLSPGIRNSVLKMKRGLEKNLS